jgi:hypothetical protein
MKINWGTGIAIVYTTFAVAMVGMVIYSTTLDHSLVTEQYYEEDLKYQSHLDKVNNSLSLASDLQIVPDKDTRLVRLTFPKQFVKIEGEILFYRPNDKSKDFSVKILPDSNWQVLIPTGNLVPGNWKLKVDWQGDGKAFYKEQTLIL